jgi:hypothetical protein
MRTDNALNDFLDRKVIGEGPLASHEGRTIPLEQLPFAYRLNAFLLKGGANISHNEGPFRAGALDPDERGVVRMWTQLHCMENEPEKLGAVILERFGRSLVFGGLVIPNGQQCVTSSRAGGVMVRQIVSYMIQDDQLVQRWDVIVRQA